jgi:hypothetical protein
MNGDKPEFDPSRPYKSAGTPAFDPTSPVETPENPNGSEAKESGLADFIKSVPTGIAKTASEFARGEQIESEQRALALGEVNAGPKIPTGAELVKAFGLHEPQGFWGQAGQLTGEFAINPATYFGPGSAVTKFLTSVTAILGGAGGKQLGGTTGELIGLAGGGMAPAAILKSMSPVFINEARGAATELLESEGVKSITAGQRTGSKATEYWEGYLGDAPFAGGKATAAREEAGKQFTRAALRRAGVNSDLATPKTIDDAFKRIGGDMDAIASRNNVKVDAKLANEILTANDEYNLVVQEGSRRPIIQKTVDDILSRTAQSPEISGEQVQAFRSRLLRLQRGAFSDPEYSNALGNIVEAIDGAISRSIRSPADLDAWKLARRQYRNLIPLAKAATGAGEQAAEGIITPAKLRQALTSDQRGRRDYARGRGDFSTLSHAGNLIMTPLPNSGTAQREMARAFASALGGAAGFMVGGASHGMGGGIGGAAIGAAAAPGVMGRAMMSKPAQSYLGGTIPGQAAARSAQSQLPSAGWTTGRSLLPAAPDLLPDAN